ncbi:MAG: DUF2786 domain-containing protein [Cytophagaceae bacterium]|nr:MAG: DUF2786 domain-containing protein [Cytophagaceae bacterium]
MMTLEQAMAKASKLLKLAESSNANEAALAAQRAQEILDRYSIDMASLEASGDGDASDNESVQRFDGEDGIDRGNASIAYWKLALATKIGQANSTRVYKSGATIGIVGRKSDVAKVRYFYILLCSEIDKLTNFHAKGKGRNYRTEFRMGVVAAIGDKLQEAKAKVAQDMRQEASGNESALVSLNRGLERLDQRQRDVDAWVRANMNFRSSNRYARQNSDARAAGYSAGQSLNVGGGRARAALGSGQGKLR